MRGSYCLIIEIIEPGFIAIGKRGRLFFPRGEYVYVGSALGCLEKRVERHCRRTKKKFWHIDYLTCHKQVRIKAVYIKEATVKEECRIAQRMAAWATVIEGFGAGDCQCPGHLFFIKRAIDWQKLQMKLWPAGDVPKPQKSRLSK